MRISNAQLETRVKAIEGYMKEFGLLEGETLEEVVINIEEARELWIDSAPCQCAQVRF
jgi:predicted RNase H-like HicB family nuclease